jgi:hypothetical protein
LAGGGRRRPWFTSAAGIIGVVLAVGACGGSAGPTKTSYDAQADTICSTYDAKLQSVGATISGATTKAEVEKALGAAIALGRAGTAKLEALRRPKGESVPLQAAFDAQEVQVTDLNDLLTAVKQDSATRTKAALTAAEDSTGRVNRLFDAAGLKTCGSGTSS